MSLVDYWDMLSQRVRDAAGRFVKVIGAAATAAALTYLVSSFTNGTGVSSTELWTAVAIAVVSAAEKFFNVAPKVSGKVRKTK